MAIQAGLASIVAIAYGATHHTGRTHPDMQ
jgi:hypothetical protein